MNFAKKFINKLTKDKVLEIFFTQSFLAILFASLICCLLGVFTLWKRLFYFGDAMSHSLLFAISLGVVFNSNQTLTLVIFAIIFAILAHFLGKSNRDKKSMIIAILSYFSIACAFLIDDFAPSHDDFHNFIFGDIVNISSNETFVLGTILLISFLYTIFAFRKILLINLNSDLAKIQKIKTDFWNLSFLILLAVSVALSVKIIGIFLITSLLILPAAISRFFAKSPKEMIFLSILISLVTSVFSFLIASNYNLKIGALTSVSLCLIFFLVNFSKKIK